MPLELRSVFAWASALILVILSISDSVTTAYFLLRGGEEANPVMAWLINVSGNWAFVLKTTLTIGIALWLVRKWEERLARMTMTIIIGIHLIVVGRHLFYIGLEILSN